MATSAVEQKPMKVSIDKWKVRLAWFRLQDLRANHAVENCSFVQFTQCRDGRLGLLVTIGSKYLPLSPNIDTAIVGQCACCAAQKQDAQLSSLDLPTPDWESTVASVGRHFPAGFESCSGVWFRADSAQCSASEEEAYKTYLTTMLDTLLKTTNLKVSVSCKCRILPSSNTPNDLLFGLDI